MKKKLVFGAAAVFSLLCGIIFMGCNHEVKEKPARTVTITGIPDDISFFMLSINRSGSGSVINASGAAVFGGKLPNGDLWTGIKDNKTTVELYESSELLTYLNNAQSGNTAAVRPVKKMEVSGLGTILIQPYKGTAPQEPLVWGSAATPLKFNSENKIIKWGDGKVTTP